MIFGTPALGTEDLEVLDLIKRLRDQLKYAVVQNHNRWKGFLRRTTFARALQGSNSIEGINANMNQAIAIIDDEKPETVEEETYRALVGYRNALTYVLQTHDDPHFELHAQVIKSLHFMMLSYDLTKLPGQWRSGGIFVIREQTGDVVHEGPDAELIPSLISELVTSIQSGQASDPIVRGAMAHLNLTMIHPFKDGNGRMARALQTLVLARDGVLSPVFCSIEEWLGRNTDAYYQILADVGAGKWNPQRDALPWVRFCLKAHFQQAATLVKRHKTVERAWGEVAKIIKANSLNDRVGMALLDATMGYQVRSSLYQKDNEVSDVVASRDLRRLSELGLLAPVGEKRGRYYEPGEPLKEILQRIRDDGKAPDPYEVIKHKAVQPQMRLPGLG